MSGRNWIVLTGVLLALLIAVWLWPSEKPSPTDRGATRPSAEKSDRKDERRAAATRQAQPATTDRSPPAADPESEPLTDRPLTPPRESASAEAPATEIEETRYEREDRLERKKEQAQAEFREAIAAGPPEVPEEFRRQVEGDTPETSWEFEQTVEQGPPPLPEHIQRLIDGPPPPIPPDMAAALGRTSDFDAPDPPAEVADQIEGSGR